MKKKLLFTAFNLDTGGVERCLVNLVNNLDKDKYDITIILQVKEGIYLESVNNNIKVFGYDFCKYKNKIIKKIINIFKYLKVLLKNYHKYDVSINYAPGYVPSSILALIASKRTVGWMHTNLKIFMDVYKPYLKLNLTNEQKVRKFVKSFFFRKYQTKIFVSRNALDTYLSFYPEDKDSCLCIYNLTDYKTILEKSKEKINLKKSNEYTFINISRHTEFDKKISRIINASSKLKKDNLSFKVILVGDGEETQNYKVLVKKLELEDVITFVGNQKNPFPYYLLGDVFVLSSAFEGFPTTYLESMILNIPIITTDVSDALSMIKDKYGVVVPNDDTSLYDAMKNAIINGVKHQKFDSEKYNNDILNQLEKVFK